jgi:hypothetical protein
MRKTIENIWESESQAKLNFFSRSNGTAATPNTPACAKFHSLENIITVKKVCELELLSFPNRKGWSANIVCSLIAFFCPNSSPIHNQHDPPDLISVIFLLPLSLSLNNNQSTHHISQGARRTGHYYILLITDH